MEVSFRPLNIRLLQKGNPPPLFFYSVSETSISTPLYSLFWLCSWKTWSISSPFPLILCQKRGVLLSNRSPGFSFLSSQEVRNWCNPIVFGDFRLASRTPTTPLSLPFTHLLCCYITVDSLHTKGPNHPRDVYIFLLLSVYYQTRLQCQQSATYISAAFITVISSSSFQTNKFRFCSSWSQTFKTSRKRCFMELWQSLSQ